MPDNFLTVAQAADALGVSERQARRYAGRLAPDDRREAGHEAGHMTGALVRLAAMQNEREKATKGAKSDVRPDVVKHEAGRMAGHEAGRDDRTPDAMTAEVLTLLKSENSFLRGMVEQHQRSEAELRAALRKALDAMPKALEGGGTLNAEKQGGEDAPQRTPDKPDDTLPIAQKQSVPRPATPRKMTKLQRIGARLFGINTR